MKQKLSFLFLFFLMSFTFLANGQRRVDLLDMKYTGGASIPIGTPIKIYQGTTRSITFEVYLNNSDLLLKTGNLYTKSKVTASASSSYLHTQETFTGNSLDSWYAKYYTIVLNANSYNATGGTLYGEFVSSVDGSSTRGNLFYIQVIPVPAVTNNVISSNQTIQEGSVASNLSGTIPSGGLGTFTYEWQKKEGSANWTTISGATLSSYSPGVLLYTTKYRRIVRSGSATDNISNEITITVNPAPALLNNTITQIGSEINGSLPSGGLNTYSYKWIIYVSELEDSWAISGNSINNTISQDIYNLADYNSIYIARVVTSGRQSTTSNYILINPIPNITQNNISINGSQILGSQPIGGTGVYSYLWTLFGGEEPYIFAETTQSLVLSQIVLDYMQEYPNLSIWRTVYSGKISQSNVLSLASFANRTAGKIGKVDNDEFNEEDIKMYPNPTTETLNFKTNYYKETNVDIRLFSEILAKEISVFKGKVSPGQTIKYNIPSNYPKGMYFYRILSENNEVKTGKVLYQ